MDCLRISNDKVIYVIIKNLIIVKEQDFRYGILVHGVQAWIDELSMF